MFRRLLKPRFPVRTMYEDMSFLRPYIHYTRRILMEKVGVNRVGEISRWRSIEALSFEPLLAIVIYSLRGNNFLGHPSREEFLSVRVAFIMVERLTFRCTRGLVFSVTGCENRL